MRQIDTALTTKQMDGNTVNFDDLIKEIDEGVKFIANHQGMSMQEKCKMIRLLSTAGTTVEFLNFMVKDLSKPSAGVSTQ